MLEAGMQEAGMRGGRDAGREVGEDGGMKGGSLQQLGVGREDAQCNGMQCNVMTPPDTVAASPAARAAPTDGFRPCGGERRGRAGAGGPYSSGKSGG